MTSPLTCFHPSNLLTYVSLLAGVAAIALASHGSLAGAGALVALSVVADTSDGAFARLFDDVPGFVGLPAPVAALIWLSTLLLQPGWGLSLAVFVATGVAMVAPLRLPRPSGVGLAAFAQQ